MASALRPPTPGAMDLNSGFPDPGLLPERLIRSAFNRAARSRATLMGPSTSGLADLRAWFAAELAGSTAAGTTPPGAGDVVIFPGSQSGLSAAFRALVGPGEPLLMESPTYWGAILAAAHNDAGHVIYLRSLTKSISPAVRVAAVIARGPV